MMDFTVLDVHCELLICLMLPQTLHCNKAVMTGFFDTLKQMRAGESKRRIWAFPRFFSDSFINATLDLSLTPTHVALHSK